MNIEHYNLKVVFTTPILGSQPTVDIAEEFIAKRAGLDELPQDERETLSQEEELTKGTTVFHRADGAPILFNYQVKGFLKEAGRVMNGKVHGGVKNLRSKVGSLVFINPRQIPLHLPEGKEIEFLSRPLRAETMQGPRVAIARSEVLPAGTWFECKLDVLPGDIGMTALLDLLHYGEYCGIGQWRSSGAYGTFTFELA